jgi:hypothetical protein
MSVDRNEGVGAMEAMQVQEQARQMFEAYGEKAIAAAAERALRYERAGDTQQVKAWRRIEAALMLMRGPRET